MITHEQLAAMCTKTRLIPFLEGQRGEGKTAFINSLGKYFDKTVSILNCSAMDSLDLMGLPEKVNGNTYYARPKFMDADIIFFDEADRIRDESVKSSLLSLWMDRAINGNALNDDAWVICAGNGSTDADNTIEFTGALKDRVVYIPFSYTTKQKIAWLYGAHGHSNLLRFFEVKPDLFEEFSSRRIENALKIQAHPELLGYYLTDLVARAYKTFLEENMVTLEHIKSGKYEFGKLTSLTKISLCHDIAAQLSQLQECGDKELKNINEFVNSLKPEEKSLYFLKLKELALSLNEFKPIVQNLNKHGFFDKQKTYLEELVK